jgi:hypothetical protein
MPGPGQSSRSARRRADEGSIFKNPIAAKIIHTKATYQKNLDKKSGPQCCGMGSVCPKTTLECKKS